jgi:hypothetical protein
MVRGKTKSLTAGAAVAIAATMMLSPLSFGQSTTSGTGTTGGTNAAAQGTPDQMISGGYQGQPGRRMETNPNAKSGTDAAQQTASPSSGVKSNNMDVPGKQAYMEGLKQNAVPAQKVTGDSGVPNQLQPNQVHPNNLPDKDIGMFPSDYPIRTLYNGPEYTLDAAEKIAMAVWFITLLVLSVLWFFYGWMWAEGHAPQHLHD